MAVDPLAFAFAPRESALLLCCARTAPDAQAMARAQGLLAEPIDWRVLLQLAARHRVLPLLARSMPKLTGVPAEVLAQLHAFASANAMQSLMLMGELSQLLRILEAENIAAAPFKGPILAQHVYGDLALRHAGDLDLLVRRADVVRAKAVFDRLGYQAIYPTSTPREQRYLQSLSPEQESAYLQAHSEHHLLRADGIVTVDLHWDLAPRDFAARLDQAELWSWLSPSPDEVRADESPMLSFRDAELLLVLCLNGAKDCWARLDRVCDVAELIARNPNLDWPRVMELSGRLGWQRIVRLGLLLSQRLLQTRLPAEIAAEVNRDKPAARLAAQSLRKMFQAHPVAVEGASTGKSLYYLLVRNRLRDRLWFVGNQLLPTVGDFAAVPLPRGLAFLHCLLRPVRLVGRHASSAWRNPRQAGS